ncbi:MAG: hypothetical protein ACOCQG_05945 [Candidatus Nanoarchaeia archaeon]
MDEINKPKSTCPADRPPTKKELEEKKRRQRRGLIFIAVFIGIILVSAVFTLILPGLLEKKEPETEDYYEYNDYEFTKVDGTWYSHGYRDNSKILISLRHGPKELEDINVTGDIPAFVKEHQFYHITFDPREENHDKYVTMAFTELSTNLRVHFGKELGAACIVEHPSCSSDNVSIITCENTDEPVIHVKREPGAEIIIEDNCAVIKGQGEELVEAVDRFLYGAYGIMRQ